MVALLVNVIKSAHAIAALGKKPIRLTHEIAAHESITREQLEDRWLKAKDSD